MPSDRGLTTPTETSRPAELAARCHEIQTGLGLTEVPEFDNLRKIGMAVRLSLHIQGLPTIKYDTLKLVATHLLGVPSVAVKSILELLAEIEFVKLITEGKTIKAVVPNVPYYESLYGTLGVLAENEGLNEAEELTIEILCRLSKSPEKMDSLKTKLGAEPKLVKRAFEVGNEGAYFRVHRSRGRDIALSPTYFSENAEIYADIVAGTGAPQVQKVLRAVKAIQGIPLSLVRKNKEIGGIRLNDDELNLLMRLAQDGAVKPPSITTEHAGKQFFLFTPTPTGAALAPTKRDIYERAMALVSAMRQGQFLPARIKINSPAAVLYTLRRDMKLGKATTEATHQYRKLVHLRIARLVDVGNGYSELQIIDTLENREALSMAYDLVSGGATVGAEVDDTARNALQQDHTFVESLVSSGELQRRNVVALTQDQQLEMDTLLLK